jgi:hypothetical protein
MTFSQLMPLSEIQTRLKDRKLHIVSKEIGLSYPTLKKLADGKPANYNYSTLIKVSDYLQR